MHRPIGPVHGQNHLLQFGSPGRTARGHTSHAENAAWFQAPGPPRGPPRAIEPVPHALGGGSRTRRRPFRFRPAVHSAWPAGPSPPDCSAQPARIPGSGSVATTRAARSAELREMPCAGAQLDRQVTIRRDQPLGHLGRDGRPVDVVVGALTPKTRPGCADMKKTPVSVGN